MKRRHVLLGGIASFAGLAGCSSNNPDTPTESTGTPETKITDSGAATETPEEALTESGVRLTVTQIEESDLSRYADDEIHEFSEFNQEQQEKFEQALEQNGIDLDQHNAFRMSGENPHRVISYRDNYYRMDYSTV